MALSISGSDPDLIKNGAVVSILVRAAGSEDGTVVEVPAQIDTGASMSCVHPAVLKQIEAAVVGRFDLAYNQGQHPACPIHLVDLCFQKALSMRALPVIAFVPSGRVHALLGRDVLDACRLNYDGPAKKWTLECVTMEEPAASTSAGE